MEVKGEIQRRPIKYPEAVGGVEPEVDRLCILAAHIGDQSGDDVLCSFTSLLIAFFRLDISLSRWLMDFVAENNVDVNPILERRQVKAYEDLTQILDLANNGLPDAKTPMWSQSARLLFQAAVDIAQELNPDQVRDLGTRHLMAAYAFRPPGGHSKQLEGWGFPIDEWQQSFVAAMEKLAPSNENWRGFYSTNRETGPATPPEQEDPGTGRKTLDEFLDGTVKNPSPALRDLITVAAAYSRSKLALQETVSSTCLFYATADGWQDRLRVPTDMERAAIVVLKANVSTAENGYEMVRAGVFGDNNAFRSPDACGLRTVDRTVEYDTFDFSGLVASNSLRRVLQSAEKLARDHFDSSTTTIAHVLVTLLNPPSQNLGTRLEEIGVTAEGLVKDIVRAVSFEDNLYQASWESAASLASPEPSDLPHAAEGTLLAGFESDSTDTEDLIGTEEEAKTFAKFVASRHFEPPMSIGLFGNWGVGKSFFMRKMQKHVEFLADGAQTYRDENQEASVYHERIVQIEFNAWHYIESNLWASLVDHLFTELHKFLSKTESREKHIDALFSGLTTVAELEKEARQILAHALRFERTAKKELQEARDKHEDSIKEHRKTTSEDIWRAVSETFFKSLETNATLQSNLSEAKKKLGLDKIADSAEALQAAIGEARTVAGRGRLVIGSLINRTGSWWLWGIVAAGVIAIPFVVEGLIYLVSKVSGEGLTLSVAASNISAFLFSAGVILAGLSKAASEAIGKLETVDGLLQNAIEQKSEEQREALAESEQQVLKHENDVKRAENTLTEAVDRVGEARRELKEGSARARLSNFIKDRATGDDYRKHLGLIATIRRDFEALTEIMCEKGSEAVDEKTAKRFRRAGVDIENIPTFDRIILYIDDLDRCPPKQVMEVLQAIHLLLAFKLFVVVVGVDARWMLGSVQDQYDRLLDNGRREHDGSQSNSRDTGTDDTERAFEAVASPYDYLEKIFQIPYWLHAMNKKERVKFFGDMARRGAGEAEAGGETSGSDPEPSATQSGAEPDSSATREKEGTEKPSKPATHGEPPSMIEDEGKSGAVDAKTAETPTEKNLGTPESENGLNRADDPSGKPAEGEKDLFYPYPENVPISEFEALFIERLSAHMTGSPRRAKRFVNVYRLIKMSLPSGEQDALVGSEGQSLNYKILLIHLAIITAAPNIAPHFLEAFSKSQKKSGKFESLADKLKLGSIGRRAADEKERLKALLGEFDELGSFSSLKGDVMEWAGIVRRYSFRGEESWFEIKT